MKSDNDIRDLLTDDKNYQKQKCKHMTGFPEGYYSDDNAYLSRFQPSFFSKSRLDTEGVQGLGVLNCRESRFFKKTGKKRDPVVKVGSDNKNLEKPECDQNERACESHFSHIITNDDRMKEIFNYIQTISISNEPVLITGECGVGKELIANEVHSHSRREGNFVAVNVAGLDDTLFSDALFGHKQGAFTGANFTRKGLVEKARGGTLFLDEVGDLSKNSQVKLLRLIQEQEYCPIGSDTTVSADVRIVAATNKKLDLKVLKKEFRKDLFYRLEIHGIHVPPLRERKGDIELLTDYFITKAAAEYCKNKPLVTADILEQLKNYHFPGNVRQLRSIIFDAVCQQDGGLLPAGAIMSRVNKNNHLPEEVVVKQAEQHDNWLNFPEKLPTLKEAAQLLIKEALKRTNGKQSEAARVLGISQQALSKRLKKENCSRSKSETH